ncbi:MAG TPA: alkaline phosphatase family protein [Gemmataceae bacterium]|nr:alkaline phosphatase family protein [Gemmataceae bacterium]
MSLRKKVLLIGWDAADWKVINPLMDQGKMPNVRALVEGGVMGQLATLHPPLSPMLWTSIATGKRPFQHGIHGFSEPTPDGLGIRPVTNLSRKCKAVWNILNQEGLRSVVVGWWPSHPAEPINGVMVSDHFHRAHGPLEKGWPLLPNSVHPPELHDTLAELRLHPDELRGEMIELFIPRAREIDQEKDPRLAGVVRTLCECVSMHSAATWLLQNQEWDFAGIYYDAIDHFCHLAMKYHPPRQDWIPEKDFELYKNVVSAGYQFHDMMLGTLLKLAGEDTTVLLMSDHGFHPDHLRPRAIPQIPAGPAIEHRDFGILAMRGPGLKKDELLHGPCVLDITPTLLTLFGLPVGADMDGKVLVGAFEQPPEVKTIPSWEDVHGADGRHPPDTRLDPESSKAALEQLVALGYIAKPNQDRAKAVTDTLSELRYNLAEAYQDADRHAEALDLLCELHKGDPDEQRFAVKRFVSCQALGAVEEMREIVADLDGRRRGLFEGARDRLKELRELAKQRFEERKAKGEFDVPPVPEEETEEAEEAGEVGGAEGEAGEQKAAKRPEPLLTPEERRDLAKARNLCRFDPPVVDYLKAQVKVAEGWPSDALELLQRVQEAHLARPGLFLQTADLYLKLRRWDEAEQTYAKALAVDPDNPHAHLGVARMALRRRDFEGAASSALEAIQRLYHYPLAHYVLGTALLGLQKYPRAAEAFRVAVSLNPNFMEAHLFLSRLYKRRLGDPVKATEHARLAREMRRRRLGKLPAGDDRPAEDAVREQVAHVHLCVLTPDGPVALTAAPLPAGESKWIAVVAGLPRSGTSMLMQMLDAGGLPILTDGRRAADDDNPRGYLEFEPVKTLYQGADWLADAAGKAVKVVAPLIPYLPAEHDYRILFIERDLGEILASQGRMLERRGETVEDTPARRARLREEYGRQVRSLKAALARRSRTQVLCLSHAEVVRDPRTAAEAINHFLGGGLDVGAMAAAVSPALHRQRATVG